MTGPAPLGVERVIEDVADDLGRLGGIGRRLRRCENATHGGGWQMSIPGGETCRQGGAGLQCPAARERGCGTIDPTIHS